MTILSVSKEKNNAVIQLNSDELVALCNILYRETRINPKQAIIYELYGSLMIARDLSQYGHIDAFCYEKIGACREKVRELNEKNEEVT